MSDRGVYCPFLNRADSRCSHHFSLDRLEHAFEHCFGKYQSCPTYLELLVERRVRRSSEMVLSRNNESAEPDHEKRDYIQLRIRPSRVHAADCYQKSVA
jgi:hypothetical protein